MYACMEEERVKATARREASKSDFRTRMRHAKIP
jgi:hypothetical protein